MGILIALFRNPAFWALILVTGVLVYYYNKLVRAHMRIEESLGGIDVQLKRRRNLIPQLTALSKLMREDKKQALEILERLIISSGKRENNLPLDQKAGAESEISRLFKGLLAELIQESHDKGGKDFDSLNYSLTEIEASLQEARRSYNAEVKNYNYLVESFPGGLMASVLGFKKAEFFIMDDEAYEDAVQNWSQK